MPFLTKGGKFVVEGGKFVTTDDPAKCKCCKPPPPPDGWKCVDGQCLPSDDGPYPTLEECRKACCAELKSGTISGSIDGCGQIDTVETVTNDTGRDAWLKASGSVDDDVLIDGEVYQEGQFPFPWENYGSPCGSTNSTNGAHDWTFSKKLGPGQSVRFGIKNNGYGGGITGTWTLNSCEEPPPPPPDCTGPCDPSLPPPQGCYCCTSPEGWWSYLSPEPCRYECGGTEYDPQESLCCQQCGGTSAPEKKVTSWKEKCGQCPPGMSDEECNRQQTLGCRVSGDYDQCTGKFCTEIPEPCPGPCDDSTPCPDGCECKNGQCQPVCRYQIYLYPIADCFYNCGGPANAWHIGPNGICKLSEGNCQPSDAGYWNSQAKCQQEFQKIMMQGPGAIGWQGCDWPGCYSGCIADCSGGDNPLP
jgi:hypothetical protein